GQVTVRSRPAPRRCSSGMRRYVFEYVTFGLVTTVLVGRLHLRRRYDLVQVNTIPDTLVFTALVPRPLGARILLDLYECMPELFATKFRTRQDHPGARLLAWLEQASIRFADHAITSTEQPHRAQAPSAGR